MKRRVVVTGMGAITPIGLNVNEFWNAVKEKRLGLHRLPILMRRIINAIWRQKSKVLQERTTWILNLPNVWNYLVSMQWQLPKKRSKMRRLIWSRKTLIVQDVPSAPVLGVCRQSSGSIKTAGKRPFQNQSVICSDDDFKYGIRQCIDCIWAKGQKHECSDSLCKRNKQYRGSLSVRFSMAIAM